MLGAMLANILGAVFDDWKHSALVLSVLPLIASVSMFFFPETPYWLASVGRQQESRYERSWKAMNSYFKRQIDYRIAICSIWNLPYIQIYHSIKEYSEDPSARKITQYRDWLMRGSVNHWVKFLCFPVCSRYLGYKILRPYYTTCRTIYVINL